MESLAVLGTDTGVGKTWVVGALCRYLGEKGYSICPQKWVQCGDLDALDVDFHFQCMGKSFMTLDKQVQEVIMPHAFSMPASPHLAAKQEGGFCDPKKIINAFHGLSAQYQTVIVEGSGGIFVPLSTGVLLVDLVETLQLPVLLVAVNRVGVINQVGMTLHCLKSRGLSCVGVLLTQTEPDMNSIIACDNMSIIQDTFDCNVWGSCMKTCVFDSFYHEIVAILEKQLGVYEV